MVILVRMTFHGREKLNFKLFCDIICPTIGDGWIENNKF